MCCAIHWIKIYPVYSNTQPSNNWGQKVNSSHVCTNSWGATFKAKIYLPNYWYYFATWWSTGSTNHVPTTVSRTGLNAKEKTKSKKRKIWKGFYILNALKQRWATRLKHIFKSVWARNLQVVHHNQGSQQYQVIPGKNIDICVKIVY